MALRKGRVYASGLTGFPGLIFSIGARKLNKCQHPGLPVKDLHTARFKTQAGLNLKTSWYSAECTALRRATFGISGFHLEPC